MGSVDHDHLETLLCQEVDGFVGVGSLVSHAHRLDLVLVHDRGATLLDEVGVAEGLELLQGQQVVHFSPPGHGRVYVISEAHVAEDGAASLRHAVKLALLHVLPVS